ncbi:MAG TPA: hypothetical protein GX527_10305 [Clostridiaceae bacterium]|nr:hypothetical protein [Clostridiaceae bacterium]
MYIGFGFENEILTSISGHSNPATIVFAKDSNCNYMMKEFIHPLDESEYLPSIKKMFSELAFKKYQSA